VNGIHTIILLHVARLMVHTTHSIVVGMIYITHTITDHVDIIVHYINQIQQLADILHQVVLHDIQHILDTLATMSVVVTFIQDTTNKTILFVLKLLQVVDGLILDLAVVDLVVQPNNLVTLK